MNDRLTVPGRFQVDVHWQDGPNVEPFVASIQGPDFLQLRGFGGFHKVEQIAGVIAARLAFIPQSAAERKTFDKIPVTAVNLAEAVLEECSRRRQQGTATEETSAALDDDAELPSERPAEAKGDGSIIVQP